jgi:D-inositol-3-phosphate glycosyltransferase
MISMHSSPVGELGTRDTGGMSVYIGEVARRLAGNGCAVDIFTRLQHSGSAKTVEPFPGVRIVHLPAGPPKAVPHLVLYRHLPQFWENLESFRHTQGIQYDLVHSHYYLSGQVGRWARERWHVPHVLMFHTLGILKNRIAGTEKEPELRITLEKRLVAECDWLLAGTEREKCDLIDLYGAPPHRIGVVPCGVDRDQFHPSSRRESRERLGLNGGARVILYVGRFDPIKGVDRLLAAAHRLQQDMRLHVLLVGGGGENTPEDEALRSICRELSLEDCVTFVGRRDHHELADHYRAADVLVLPSHYESFGLVVLEALACGTPVVAMRVGVVEDVIHNGLNGWIVADNSSENLAEGVRQVLNGNGAQRPMVDSIRATVADYDWRLVADVIHNNYRMLIGRGGTGRDVTMDAGQGVSRKATSN